MIKHVSLAVVSLLFVAMVSGCGDSKPSSTEEPQVTKKEAPSSAKQEPVDKKTQNLMQYGMVGFTTVLEFFNVDNSSYPKTLEEINAWDSTVIKDNNYIKEAQEAGIKFEYVHFTTDKGQSAYILTAISPDGKYKMTFDNATMLGTLGLPLEKVE